MTSDSSAYWNAIADEYQDITTISVDDFHYGPLLPGDNILKLLPDLQPGARCLELACGAGQNSLYLARHCQAECTAVDNAEKQLERGRKLAAELNREVHFRMADLDALPGDIEGPFELIHSSYGLPFAKDPATVVQRCAELLAPAGTLLLSMGHPLYGAEWLEASPGETGIFVADYYTLPCDDRRLEDGTKCEAHYHTMEEMVTWLTDAGLHLSALLEPQPLQPNQLQDIPYHSPNWFENLEEHQRIPVVVILKAVKP